MAREDPAVHAEFGRHQHPVHAAMGNAASRSPRKWLAWSPSLASPARTTGSRGPLTTPGVREERPAIRRPRRVVGVVAAGRCSIPHPAEKRLGSGRRCGAAMGTRSRSVTPSRRVCRHGRGVLDASSRADLTDPARRRQRGLRVCVWSPSPRRDRRGPSPSLRPKRESTMQRVARPTPLSTRGLPFTSEMTSAPHGTCLSSGRVLRSGRLLQHRHRRGRRHRRRRLRRADA